jgi:phosphoribosylamine---glycine ligase
MDRAKRASRELAVMAFGVGSFAHGTMQILKEAGAEVSAYLTRTYAHYPPSLAGLTFSRENSPSPVPLLRQQEIDLVVPMSIDWAQAPWAAEFLASKVRILSPIGEAMRIERERDFGRKLCRDFKIPFPLTHVAPNRLEADAFVRRRPCAYVLKNPLCGPTSPIHTILCETVEDTRAWLRHVDYAEGVFLQEYLGPCEAGHIVFVSGGEIYSLVTNQEYKRAFSGNMGIVAGAPLGGLVEKDPDDKYGLARAMIHPLRPWLRQVRYHGPLQVTAVRRGGRWHVIEYNIRLGITSGNMILRLLENPLETLWAVANNRRLAPVFRANVSFGCSLTLAGYGYPYVKLDGPCLPVDLDGRFDCDVWWNEVARKNGGLVATGHRIADVVALADTLERAVATAYRNIRKIRVLGSYYRTDVGRILWPPGNP